MIAGIFISAAGLFALLFRQRRVGTGRFLLVGSLGIGIVAPLLVPIAWALSVVLLPGHGTLPSADLARLTRSTLNADRVSSKQAKRAYGLFEANRIPEKQSPDRTLFARHIKRTICCADHYPHGRARDGQRRIPWPGSHSDS